MSSMRIKIVCPKNDNETRLRVQLAKGALRGLEKYPQPICCTVEFPLSKMATELS